MNAADMLPMVPPPVAVGGLGGSGTRLIATIMADCAFYLGDHLNAQLDNLWFTLLFKRPSWFAAFPSDREISEAAKLFVTAMTTGLAGNLTQDGRSLIERAVAEAESAPIPTGAGRAAGESLASSHGLVRPGTLWGWKEPNSHVFLPELAESVPGLRYIHVLRSGLDMAFSRNQQQLRNWGPHFLGLQAEPDPVLALDYWVFANRRAIELGASRLGRRFFLLNYDRFCTEPEEEVGKLLAFLGVSADHPAAAKASSLILPRSIGRHMQCPLDGFSPKQLNAVRELEQLPSGPSVMSA